MNSLVISSATSAVLSSPRPPLVFRIGVVGHRPNRLQEADLTVLSERLQHIVRAVRDEVLDQFELHRKLYDDRSPVIRALSPLAEGVDRLFAEQALTSDAELTVVLPFPQTEFEKDFSKSQALEPDSLNRFRQLLKRASAVFELDGSRHDSSKAYHVAGDVVLNQSDILIVVWDGERHNRRGGTEETFDDAVQRGVPVIWIDAHAPHHWRIVTQPIRRIEELRPGRRAALTKSHGLLQLRTEVRRLIELPSPDVTKTTHGLGASSDQSILLQRFYAEQKPRFSIAFVWKLFRNLVGDARLQRPTLTVSPYEESVASSWPRNRDEPVATMIDRLRASFAWADKLADRYADNYRSAFVTAFLLAAAAVALALAPLALRLEEHSLGETLCAVGEFAAICLILLLVVVGRKQNWHQRWLDYRLLAEIIRHQRLIAPLGGIRATPSVPEHWAGYGDPAASWMAWYARALERSLPLPTARVNQAYLAACLKDLADQLSSGEGQIGFHNSTAARCERIEHRLHKTEIVLLAATIMCCLQHILQGTLHSWPQVAGPVLTFCCGFFPALGAALAGITNQAEFRRITQRSQSMAQRLKLQSDCVQDLRKQLDNAACENRQLSADIATVAGDTARMMVNEVLDWRVIFQDRPLRTT